MTAPVPMSAVVPATRPWNVTLVAVLALLLGLLEVFAGVYQLFSRNDLAFQIQTGLDGSGLTVSGLASLVFGAVTLLLAIGLFGGSRLARGVIALLAVIRIALAVFVFIVGSGSTVLADAVVEGLISLLLLVLLFAGERTQRFFARG